MTRVGKLFNQKYFVVKGHQRRPSTVPPLPQFSHCNIFNFVFVCILLRSPLPLNASLLAMLYFRHFLTSKHPTHFPHVFPSFIPAFIRPEPISTSAATVPRSPSLDSLQSSSFLCYFNPPRFSSSHHHIHSSIPQLPALRTSAIINLVQTQELGHWGTLKHVTLE